MKDLSPHISNYVNFKLYTIFFPTCYLSREESVNFIHEHKLFTNPLPGKEANERIRGH